MATKTSLETSLSSEIAALDACRRKAMIEGDVTTLSDLFAPEMAWIHASSRQESKDQTLSAIRTRSVVYRSIECSHEALRVFGDTALITGIADICADIGGQARQLRNRFTVVWSRVNGRWQVVNWQSTPAPQDPPH